ncbi:hypothetical protein BO223_01685 [Faecalibaculum rodentium]|uniref:Uncharacterized protein n=1 Tax=Faecalibaculum rodentium TaxID=1702221 RepID=A0A1Q9YMS4_9FIRM|nr:hypothetical protein BO223_01685 [Faecalibaculum rodentium]
MMVQGISPVLIWAINVAYGTRPSLRRNFSQVGPKSKEIPAEFDMLSESYKQGRISSRAAAERLNISHTTFLRWCRTILPME